MPGFADKLTPDQRWDLINFVLARAAGTLTNALGPSLTTAAAPPLPDFAFEQRGAQNTLSQTLKSGPLLLMLFAERAPSARLQQLMTQKSRLTAAALGVIAVDLGQSTAKATPNSGASPPFVVKVSDDVRATLALFRSKTDGGETDLMLDRGANVRARWTKDGRRGLADPNTLISDAIRVASIPVAAANHAGHGE